MSFTTELAQRMITWRTLIEDVESGRRPEYNGLNYRAAISDLTLSVDQVVRYWREAMDEIERLRGQLSGVEEFKALCLQEAALSKAENDGP